jgi:hypothetical protein
MLLKSKILTAKRLIVPLRGTMVTDAPSNKNYVLKETSSKGLQSRAVKIEDFKCP